jgi:hypothetical protein
VASAFHAVEASGVARFMREALYAYPAVEAAHIAGLALLFGSIAIVDLRLLGLGRRVPLAPLVEFAVPWSIGGFVLAALTGSLMVTAHVDEFFGQPLFWLKMGLVATAGVNAVALRRGALRRAGAALDAAPSPRVRLAAGLSLALWTAVIACGRMLAYF